MLLQNRYQILQKLASGGFGETYLAEDTHMPSRRCCVIKQLKPMNQDPAVYAMVKDRFEKEAILLEKLGQAHAQIPELYGYFEDQGQFYLVQEWIEGQTLTELLHQQGKLPEATVKEILIKLLPVLTFIQGQHIIHRDIKPDNIILRRADGLPILIDFGAVKETMGTVMTPSGQSTASVVIGTPGFMPSEQMAGRPFYSSDVYALGLTAIYLLTGKIPQELESDPMTGELQWQQEALQLDLRFAEILNRAIQSHPRDRFATAQTMLDCLQPSPSPLPSTQVSQPPLPPTEPIAPASAPPSQPPTAVTSSPPVSSSSQSASSQWKAPLLLGLIVVVLSGGASYLYFDQQKQHQNQLAQLEAEKEKEAEARAKAEEEAQKAAEARAKAEEEAQKEAEARAKAEEEAKKTPTPTPTPTVTPNPTLNPRSSCGDPYQPNQTWYAVVGNANALSQAQYYCNDAYIRGKDGLTQVASFTSQSRANNFAAQLSKATGYDFWIR